MKQKTNLYLAQSALLSAAALVLSALEMLVPDIPVPIPGAKPGFSNIATMLSLEILGLPAGLSVTVIKSIFVLLTRGFTAFAMSFCGGIISTVVMYILIRIKKQNLSYTGIGVIGALCHNMGQLLISSIIAGSAVFFYTPVLMILSVIFGTVTGIASVILLPPVIAAVNKIFNPRQPS